MATVDEILDESFECSSFSAEPSFTLEDILLEPVDDDILEEELFNQSDLDDFFEDSSPEKPNLDQDLRLSHQKYSSDRFTETQMASNLKAPKRHARLKQFSIPAATEADNVTAVILKNVTTLFSEESKSNAGIPTAIAATGSRFLAVGTSIGNIVLFEVGVSNYKLLRPQQKKYGAISSLSLSRDNKFLISGHENGLIVLWDLYYYSIAKSQLISNKRILKVIFCSQSYGHFLVNDADGNIFLYTLEKYMWLSISSQRLIENTHEIYHNIKYHKLQGDKAIVVMCSLDYVYLMGIYPKIEVIARIGRPESVSCSKIPNIELGQCQLRKIAASNMAVMDILCISWGKSIYIYKIVDNGSQYQVTLLHNFSFQFAIYNMEFITTGIVVLLDSKNTLKSYKIEQWDSTTMLKINQKEIAQQIMYQRFVKDKNNHYIKLYNNVIINCCYSPTFKELFMICKHSVIRVRLHSWSDYLNNLMKNIKPSTDHSSLSSVLEPRDKDKIEVDKELTIMVCLKVCMELYHENMNIFSDRVKLTSKVMDYFTKHSLFYLRTCVDLAHQSNYQYQSPQPIFQENSSNSSQKHPRTQKELISSSTMDIVIEYLLQLNQEQYLFNTVFPWIKSKHPDEVPTFFKSLSTFIELTRLNNIPNVCVYREIIDHYIKENEIALIDTLIMNLSSASVYYQESVEICTQYELYRSLAYICSINEDYLSPANKLMYAITIKNQHNNYPLLLQYLSTLLDAKYLNKTTIASNKMKTILCELSIWLTCKETVLFFAGKVQSQQSHKMSTEMLESLNEDFYGVLLLKLFDNLLKSTSQFESQIHYVCQQLIINTALLEDHVKVVMIRGKLVNLILGTIQYVHFQYEELMFVWGQLTNPNVEFNKAITFLHRYHREIYALKEEIEIFQVLKQCAQLEVLYYLLSERTIQKDLLDRCLQGTHNDNNRLLSNFIFSKFDTALVNKNLSTLIALNLDSTIQYLINKHESTTINPILVSIAIPEVRYLAVRKALLLIRENKRQQSSTKTTTKIQGESEQKPKEKIVINNLSPELMHFYIESLCKYKKENRIYKQLRHNQADYQPEADNLYQVVNKYQLAACEAILLSYANKNKESFSKYSQVYSSVFHRIFEQWIRKEHSNEIRFFKEIYDQLLALALIINTPEYWVSFMNAIVKPLMEPHRNEVKCDKIEKIYRITKEEPFVIQLTSIIETTLINVRNKGGIQVVSKFISENSYLLSKSFILNSLSFTLNSYSRTIAIYEVGCEMVVQDQISQFQYILGKGIHGLSIQLLCHRCRKPIKGSNETRVKLYPCSHSYHPECLEYDRCYSCLMLEVGEKPREKEKEGATRENKGFKENESQNQNEQEEGKMSVKASMEAAELAEEEQEKRTIQVFESLAFEEFLNKEDNNAEVFGREYENYLMMYQNR